MKSIPVNTLTYQTIPTRVSETDFTAFILPHLGKKHKGPKPKLSGFKLFNYIMWVLYTGAQWKSLQDVIKEDGLGNPEIHYTTVFKHFQYWCEDGSFWRIFESSVIKLDELGKIDWSILYGDGTTTVAKKGGDNLGYSGHKHFKGEKIVAFCDNNRNIIAPFVTAPGNRNECPLFPESFDHVKRMAALVGADIEDSTVSLDGAYDSKANRKMIFNAKMIPNIPYNKRNRKKTKPGPKRIYDAGIQANRFNTIEVTFAWEDKFRRLQIRYERKSQNHFGFKLLAYSMLNFRNLNFL